MATKLYYGYIIEESSSNLTFDLFVTTLTRSHLKDMGFTIVGDRITFLEYLKQLKKHKRDLDRSRALWTATTPVCSLGYHRSFGEYLFQVSLAGLASQPNRWDQYVNTPPLNDTLLSFYCDHCPDCLFRIR